MPSRERARLIKLQAELDGRVRLAREELRGRLGSELTTTAQAEGPAVLAALEKATPTEIHAMLGGVPDVQVVKALTTPIGVRTWSEAIDVGLLEMRDRVQREVAVSLAQGASMDKAARAIRTASGFVEAYKNQASNIARTEIQRVANSVAHDTYAANLDVIKGVTRLATLDTRTCMVCAPLHNVTWLYGPGGNLLPNPEHGPHITPPLHPRCRCFDAPLTKSFAELGLARGVESSRPRAPGWEPTGKHDLSRVVRATVQGATVGDPWPRTLEAIRSRQGRHRRLCRREPRSELGRVARLGDLVKAAGDHGHRALASLAARLRIQQGLQAGHRRRPNPAP